MARARALLRKLSPVHWLNRYAEHYAVGDEQRKRSLVVDGPEATGKLLRRDLVRTALVGVASVGVVWLPDDDVLWRGVAQVVLGGFIGAQGIAGLRRASAYRQGWLEGRQRFVAQSEHHKAQGNTPADWVQTELEHDVVHVLGFPPDAAARLDEDGER